MKVKKMKEAKFGDLEAQLLNLEKMVQTIEWTTRSMQVKGKNVGLLTLAIVLESNPQVPHSSTCASCSLPRK